MRAIAIGIPFIRRRSGAAIDAQAQAHFDRVIADGGLVPSGLSGVNAFFTTVKTIYATSDITTAISVGLDAQVLGYKLGAGAGTTLGQAAQKLYSCSGASGDVVQTTAASQPLLLVHEGENYWFGSGVSGNYVSTPNSAANSITGDIEFICDFKTPPNFLANTLAPIVAKFQGAGNQSTSNYMVVTNAGASNVIQFYESDGTTNRILAASVTWAANTRYLFKITCDVDNGAGSNVRSIFQSTDNGATWNLLQSSTTAGVYLRNNSSRILEIGSFAIGTNAGILQINSVTISNTIGGAPVVDFNPNQYNAANSQTQWVSTSGETWTINVGTATTGYKGHLCTKTIIQGDGVDDSLVTSSTINLSSAFTIYAAFKGYNNEGGNGRITFGKQNIDGAVFRNNATTIGSWIGAAGAAVLNQTATVLNLNLATFKRKVSSNTLQVNNGAIATNTGTNPIVQSNISVFFATTYGVSNSLITSGIISNLEDDTTQKTSMYNYIRSINDNSF